MMIELLASLSLLLQSADDWPAFRGPLGDGTAPSTSTPPLDWSETRNVAWKTEIPGRGRSSPVVLGERIFLTTAREKGVVRKKIGPDDMQTAERVELSALAVDRATGKIVWETALRAVDAPDPVHWLNSWATPTPAAEPGRLYCDFGGWGTWCLDPATGKVLWEKRIPYDHQVGPGSSLALHDGKVLMIRDGRDAQYVGALDGKTGDFVWKTERPPIGAKHPNARKSFSSPVLVKEGEKTVLLAVGPHWAAAYDPVNGSELWRLRHGDGFSIGAAPVAAHGRIYFSTGCMRPVLVAMKAGGRGDVSETHAAWKASKSIPVMSSPLVAGERLAWVSDDGLATFADASTGMPLWQERLGQSHLASPILWGERIYFFGRDGKTTVAKASPTFEKLSENVLEGTVTGTPAFSGKSIFLRSDTHLYRLEAR
jgi:hypothetical protein